MPNKQDTPGEGPLPVWLRQEISASAYLPRRTKDERARQEQQRAACEYIMDHAAAICRRVGVPWPGGEAIEAYTATTRKGLAMDAVARATPDEIRARTALWRFGDDDAIPDDTALPLSEWNAKVDAILADVAQHHADETHADTLPTADAINAMDGPQLTALALTLGLAPVGHEAYYAQVDLNWAPHRHYVEAAEVVRMLRILGMSTYTEWSVLAPPAVPLGRVVAYDPATGARAEVTYHTDAEEPRALLLCACTVVAGRRRRERGGR